MCDKICSPITHIPNFHQYGYTNNSQHIGKLPIGARQLNLSNLYTSVLIDSGGYPILSGNVWSVMRQDMDVQRELGWGYLWTKMDNKWSKPWHSLTKALTNGKHHHGKHSAVALCHTLCTRILYLTAEVSMALCTYGNEYRVTSMYVPRYSTRLQKPSVLMVMSIG